MPYDDAPEALAERFLDLWQDNVRLWARDTDMMTADDLEGLLKAIIGAGDAQGDGNG